MLAYIDWLFVILAAVLPVVFVVRWGFKGVIAGAFANWIIMLGMGYMIHEFDPEAYDPMLQHIWLVGGLFGGFFYSLFIYIVVWKVKAIFKR